MDKPHPERETIEVIRSLVTLLLFVVPVFAVANDSEPEKTVHEVTLAVTTKLANSAERLKQESDYVKTIVADLVLPHIDFPTLAAASLSSHWEELSDGERRCVTDGFRERLVERYARFLLDYEYTNIMTERLDTVSRYVYVAQTATTPHPQPLDIKYKMEFLDGAWKVVDLIIAEVSLVRSYEVSFGEEIEQVGIGDFLRTFPRCRNR